jgi:hypothetical protein
MDATVVLGLFGSAVHLTSYGLYNRQVFLGQSRPNTATWILWAFLATLNSTSYLMMSHDWIKSATPIAGALACLFTLGFSFFRGKLSRLTRFDWAVLAIGIAAGLIWWVTKSAGWANMLLQAAFVLSNFPTYRGVWRDPSTEKPLPWFGFALAYAIGTATVLLRWSGNWMDLGYPVISLVADGGVGAAVLLRRRMLKRSDGVTK